MNLRLRAVAAAAVAAAVVSFSAIAQGASKPPSAFDLLRERDYPKALEQFKKDNASYPRVAPLLDGQAWCEFFLGRLDLAEEGFKKALAVDPNYRWSKDGLAAVEAARAAPMTAANAALAASSFDEARALFQKIYEGKTAAPQSSAADAAVGLGRALYGLGRYDDALKAFNQALQKRSGFADAYRGIGFCLYAKKKWAEAATPFTMALKANPNDAETRAAAAWCRYFKKDYAEAEKEFLKLAEGPKPTADAWRGVGWCREFRKAEDEALDAFRRAIDSGPEIFDADLRALAYARPKWRDLFRLAAWSSLRNDLDAWAVAEFRAILAAAPEDVDARLGLAFGLYRTRDYSGAVALCDALIREGRADAAGALSGRKIDGTRARVVCGPVALRAWSLLRLGSHQAAIEGFRADVQARGDRPDARCGLGYALLAAGDAAAAEAQFSEAAALLPGYAEAAQGFQAVAAWRRASYDEAWGLMAETRYEDAAAIFRRLADGEDPRFPAAERSKALASFGFARWRSEDAAAAEAAWNEALKDDPACGLALKGLGMARRKIGDVGGAADRLKTALKLPGFESDYETLVELGLSELSRGAFDDAAAAFQSAIVVAPEFAAAYDGAARVEWKRGKLVEARIYFERSIALDPIAADAADLREAIGVEKEFFKLHGAFGWAWLKLLRNDRAEAAFRAAVKFDPKEPEAPRGLALARLRLGDFKEAAELFGQYFSKAPTKENPWGVLSGAYSEWGWTLYSAGRFGEAEAAFTKLAALHAGEPVAYADPFVGLGWCALGRRQWDRARENFLKAIVISPRDEAASKGLEALKKEQP